MNFNFLKAQADGESRRGLLRQRGGTWALALTGVGVAIACAQAENEPYGISTGGMGLTSSTDGMGGATVDSTVSSASADTIGGPTSAVASSDTVSSSSESTSGSTTGSTSSSLTSAISAVTVNSASATDNSATMTSSTSSTSAATTGDTTTGDTSSTSTTGGVDNCPDDPEKTEPGICGCGVADNNANCESLAANLVHRYSFDGTGTTVTDSVGNADSTASGASQSGGNISLDGTGTVSIPSGTISDLGTVTIEAWLTWNGGDAWQRVFDFGDNDGTEGLTYLFLTPQAMDADGVIRAAITTSGTSGETVVNGNSALPGGSMTHVAVTVNGSLLQLFVDGASVGSETFTGAVSSLNDTNNLIGGSQFSADPGFQGTIHEFRIYSPAVSSAALSTSNAMGPDVALE